MKILNQIQKNLKAPKDQKNNFGNYKYRSCEDILEAVKPLLGNAILTIADEIWLVGDRHYVKATATIKDGEEIVSVSAYAREALEKKGMDAAQITGATSSYARKYALNGLFCIDDTKDADTRDNREVAKPAVKSEVIEEVIEEGKPFRDVVLKAITFAESCGENKIEALKKRMKVNKFSKEEMDAVYDVLDNRFPL